MQYWGNIFIKSEQMIYTAVKEVGEEIIYNLMESTFGSLLRHGERENHVP